MKKAISYILFFIAAVLLISAYSERVIKAEEGYSAPEMRMRANGSHAPFELLSVNTDADPTLFHEVIKKDNLDRTTQFHISDAKAKNMTSNYRLDCGFSSYLIDPQGKIVAINPSVQTLEKFLSSR